MSVKSQNLLIQTSLLNLAFIEYFFFYLILIKMFSKLQKEFLAVDYNLIKYIILIRKTQ